MVKNTKPGKKGKDINPEVKVTSEPVKKKSTNPFQFLQQVRAEGRKVTWTSRNETMISSVMVLIMVMIMSVFFFIVDWALRIFIQFILNIG